MIAVRGLLRSARATLLPVAALMIVTGLFRASQNMAQTTLSLLGRERVHAGPGTIGALSAMSFLMMLAGTLLVAPRIHPHGRRAAVASGLVALLVGLVAFALAASVTVLALAAALIGIAGGITFPTLATMAGQVAPAQRDRTLALYTLALSVSLALGPLLEAAVLHSAGGSLRVAYLVFAALPALALALIAVRVRRGLPAGVDGAPPAASAAGAGQRVSPPSWGAYRAVLARPLWRLAVTGVLMYAVPFACVVAFGAVLAETLYGERPAAVELALAVFFGTSLISRAALALRPPGRWKLALLWLSVATTVLGLALLAAGRSVVMLLTAMAVLGIPHGLTFPIALGLSADGVPRAELAWANAALMAVNSLAAVVTPGLLGVLAAAVGYREMVAACLVPVACFAAVLGWQSRAASRASGRP